MKSRFFLLFLWSLLLCLFSNCEGMFDQNDYDTRFLMVNPSENDLKEFLNSQSNVIHGDLILHDLDYLTDLHYFKYLKVINGEMELSDNENLKSMAGLSNLTVIEGRLQISNNNQITNLHGLNSLETVNGLSITSNLSLGMLTGLEKLVTINGSVIISDNTSLLDLSGLKNLKTIDGEITISKTQSFKDFSGLDSTVSFKGIKAFNSNILSFSGLKSQYRLEGDIWISDCPELTNINCFLQTRYVDGSIILANNSSLNDLSGLSNILNIGGACGISSGKMANLKGFENLNSVEGVLYIKDNDYLYSLDGIENVDKVSGEITITNNFKLKDFCGIRNLFVAGDFKDSVYIYQNQYNPTVDEIVNGECNQDSLIMTYL